MGSEEGGAVTNSLGDKVGCFDGSGVGELEGCDVEGLPDGLSVGVSVVGLLEGGFVGSLVIGLAVGSVV